MAGPKAARYKNSAKILKSVKYYGDEEHFSNSDKLHTIRIKDALHKKG